MSFRAEDRAGMMPPVHEASEEESRNLTLKWYMPHWNRRSLDSEFQWNTETFILIPTGSPAREALIKSLSNFILIFLFNARNQSTRIASYLRRLMT